MCLQTPEPPPSPKAPIPTPSLDSEEGPLNYPWDVKDIRQIVKILPGVFEGHSVERHWGFVPSPPDVQGSCPGTAAIRSQHQQWGHKDRCLSACFPLAEAWFIMELTYTLHFQHRTSMSSFTAECLSTCLNRCPKLKSPQPHMLQEHMDNRLEFHS